MKIYGFTEEKEGFMEIENTLHSMQKFVGGLIDVVALTPNIDLVVNDEGLINGSEPRVIFLEDGKIVNCIIMGDCFVCRHDGKGNFESILETDLPVIRKKLLYLNSEQLKLLGLLFLIS